jgi:hypothetical protein
MKKRLLSVALTGLASPMVMMIALLVDPSAEGWASIALLAPGHFAATVFHVNAANSPGKFGAEFALDLIVVWIILLIVVTLFQILFGKIGSRREHA